MYASTEINVSNDFKVIICLLDFL